MPRVQRNALFSVIRYTLNTLTLGFSIAILTCAIDAQKAFDIAIGVRAWWTPTFGDLLDATALRVAIGTSSVILVFSILLGAVQIIGSLKRRNGTCGTNGRWACAERITLLGIPAILAVVILCDLIFVGHHERNQTRAEYISVQSWTCTWKPRNGNKINGIPGTFGQICHESQFVHWIMVPLLLFQLAMLVVTWFDKPNCAVGPPMPPMPAQQMVNTARGIARKPVARASTPDSFSEDNISIRDDEKEPASWPL